jgi:predicted XRE-type DNA-binding protein
MMKRNKITDVADNDFIIGSGDYLKDRGYAEPAETRAKFFLANQIAVAVEELAVSQADAARITGLKQPDVSRIINGNVKDYSVWRLIKALSDLGWNISIEVERHRGGDGHIYAVDKARGGDVLALA